MNLNQFLNECQEKGVLKYLSIYIVSSWVFLQVVSVISDPLKLPKATITYSLLFLLIGLPFYIFLLWKYQIKPLNKKAVSELSHEEDLGSASSKSAIELNPDNESFVTAKSFNKSFQKIYFIVLGIIGIIAISVAGLIINTAITTSENLKVSNAFLETKASDKIAILTFDNNTADEKYDIVGKMAVDWIMHGITENRLAQVISPKIIDDYSKVLKASMLPSANDSVVTNYLKPSKIIMGDFYLKGDRLLLQSSITDANMDRTLIAFKPIDCDAKSPLECIEALKQRILGFLVTESKPLDNLQESPPNFEAYQNLLLAKNNYDNNDEYLRYVNAAIAADNNYYEAKVNRLAHYYNLGEYRVADSLLKVLSKETSTNERQLNNLKIYQALLQGNNRNIYRYLKKEYAINPFDLETNSSFMTVAKQFVNRPEDVGKIYDEISMKGMDVIDCEYCSYRYLIKALADIQLGKLDSAITLVKPFAKTKGKERLKEVLLKAYVQSGKSAKAVKSLLVNFNHVVSKDAWRRLMLSTGKEYLLKNKPDLAKYYWNQLITSFPQAASTGEDLQLLAHAFFYDEKRQAIAYQKIKKPNRAESVLQKLQNKRGNYDYGNVDYALARYHAALSDDKEAIDYLYRAVASGKRYNLDAYQNEILFKPYLASDDFEKIMSFWK